MGKKKRDAKVQEPEPSTFNRVSHSSESKCKCPCCLDPVDENIPNRAKGMTCSHIVHQHCLDKWMTSSWRDEYSANRRVLHGSRCCPICRAPSSNLRKSSVSLTQL